MADVNSGNPGSTGSQGAGNIPEVFQKFVDPATGSVDMNKAAEAYRNAEQKITLTTQEKLDLKRAYDEVVGKAGTGGARTAPAGVGVGDGRGLTVEELLTDPEGTLDRVISKKLDSAARPVMDKLIEKDHPEVARKADGSFKDPAFVDGLGKYAATLPISVQQSLQKGDYNTADWVISSYKRAVKEASGAASGEQAITPFSESGKGPSKPTSGTQYKRSDIRKMVRDNPREYASKIDDITKAYEEGRVILD